MSKYVQGFDDEQKESHDKKRKLNGEGNGTFCSEDPQGPKTSANQSPSPSSADESKSNEESVSNTETKEEVSSDEKKITLPKDAKERIKYLFLVDMPEDFYSFWELCKSLCKISPCGKFCEDADVQINNFKKVHE